MWQAYVGIVSRQGLEVFCPEHTQTVRFLWQRVRRQRGQAACFWSVVPDEAAAQVRAALHLGRPRTALHVLQSTARDWGHLLSPDADSTAEDSALRAG
jgi:hypothetical protein